MACVHYSQRTLLRPLPLYYTGLSFPGGSAETQREAGEQLKHTCGILSNNPKIGEQKTVGVSGTYIHSWKE